MKKVGNLMHYPNTFEKNSLILYTKIQQDMQFCRKNGTLLNYHYNLYIQEYSRQKIIIIESNDDMLSPMNWNDSDLFLFRYYLEPELQKLPIYGTIVEKDTSCYFIG